jgi:hypothetical protein
MKFIEIKHVKQEFGFRKPEIITFPGVQFDNGKIAYLDEDGDICTSDSRSTLQKELLAVSIETSDKGCKDARD